MQDLEDIVTKYFPKVEWELVWGYRYPSKRLFFGRHYHREYSLYAGILILGVNNHVLFTCEDDLRKILTAVSKDRVIKDMVEY